jgi:xanthine dehydrogenase accessory factor
MLDAGQLVRRTVRLADGGVTLQPTSQASEVELGAIEFCNTFGPAYRMLIIGAGAMAAYLATMALFNGFAVTVCDPRSEHSGPWSVPGSKLSTDMPDDLVRAMAPDRRTCVVALTHDPKLDDLALLEALQSDAFYVGAIGSRRNHAARRQRMIEHLDQTPETLQRLHGPVGLDIGSKTPPEIAVSIMAEVLAVKNGMAPSRLTR